MQIPRPRILIVDDEPNVLLTVAAILRQEGYDTDTVPNGEEAIEAIHTRHYDLVLTDLKMPGVDGLGVLQEVRNCSPDTVTVMMTGFGSVDSALEAVQLGAYEYLLKPAEVVDLKAAVHRSLERKRLSEIDTLYRVSRRLTSTLDHTSICDEVAAAVQRVLKLANACVVVFDRDLVPREGPQNLRAAFDTSMLAALRTGGTVTHEDAGETTHTWAEREGLHSFVFVPGVVGTRLVCVLAANNGSEPFEFHASAMRFLQGVTGQAALALDNASLVAELKENNRKLEAANSRLRELDKLKSQFLSVATHELRTPLSIILGYNAMLAESLGPRLTPEEQETLDESVQACKRLIRLVNSMLDISQIESGKMRMNFAPADLRRVATNVITLFQAEARQKNLALHLEVPARMPQVKMDAERVEQVLVNLLGNALKFTSQGAITLTVRVNDSDVEISVRDTGIGIAPENQAWIFDEFTQIRGQIEKRQREGSGLGLAIAKRIVEAHGGRIEVDSTPGQGSTFRFYLPLKLHRPQPAKEAVSA